MRVTIKVVPQAGATAHAGIVAVLEVVGDRIDAGELSGTGQTVGREGGDLNYGYLVDEGGDTLPAVPDPGAAPLVGRRPRRGKRPPRHAVPASPEEHRAAHRPGGE